MEDILCSHFVNNKAINVKLWPVVELRHVRQGFLSLRDPYNSSLNQIMYFVKGNGLPEVRQKRAVQLAFSWLHIIENITPTVLEPNLEYSPHFFDVLTLYHAQLFIYET
jgi:hypothetical protein